MILIPHFQEYCYHVVCRVDPITTLVVYSLIQVTDDVGFVFDGGVSVHYISIHLIFETFELSRVLCWWVLMMNEPGVYWFDRTLVVVAPFW
jgi:hypothetical protein